MHYMHTLPELLFMTDTTFNDNDNIFKFLTKDANKKSKYFKLLSTSIHAFNLRYNNPLLVKNNYDTISIFIDKNKINVEELNKILFQSGDDYPEYFQFVECNNSTWMRLYHVEEYNLGFAETTIEYNYCRFDPFDININFIQCLNRYIENDVIPVI